MSSGTVIVSPDQYKIIMMYTKQNRVIDIFRLHDCNKCCVGFFGEEEGEGSNRHFFSWGTSGTALKKNENPIL